MGKEWDANTIGRVFGIIDEALYSMALYSEINPSNRDNTIFDPYLRKFWKTISDNAVLISVMSQPMPQPVGKQIGMISIRSGRDVQTGFI